MDAITSPTKRRALASLDANALSSPKPLKLQQQQDTLKPVGSLSPFKDDVSAAGRKRALDAAAANSVPEKRACIEEDAQSRSQSPDCSSLFDTSTHDNSWANTTATEPDTSPARRTLTREQAREKAEILRLRLGLASYKFRTGQTTIPLANLEHRPIPQRVAPTVREEHKTQHGDQEEQPQSQSSEGDEQGEEEEDDEKENEDQQEDGEELDNRDAGDASVAKEADTPGRGTVAEEDARIDSGLMTGSELMLRVTGQTGLQMPE